MVAGFALFHGHVHGPGLLGASSSVDFALGAIAATALLHAAGMLAGYAMTRTGKLPLVRGAGGAMALAGATLLAGTLV